VEFATQEKDMKFSVIEKELNSARREKNDPTIQNDKEAKDFLKYLEKVDKIYSDYIFDVINKSKTEPVTYSIVGSWLELNFLSIDLQTKMVSLIQFKEVVKIDPVKYDDKKIDLAADNIKNNFLHNQDYVDAFGKEIWEKVKIPVTSDTRYREDLIWLFRYFKLIKSVAKESGASKLEMERVKLEALKLATRWKQLLEGYVLLLIKKVSISGK
jgi:hypothetical protein